MLIYDKAYMDLKNKYIVPLSNYSVPYNHLRNTNIKKTLLEKNTSVSIISDKEYKFYFDEIYLFKALLGDIEAFYIRKLIQESDSVLCTGSDFSANWNIVTNYYNAFFAASLLLRLCFRGNIFLEPEVRKSIEKNIAYISGSVVKLDSKQYFEVYEENERYVLKLVQENEGTHESVWRYMDNLIDELIVLSRKKSEEKLLLTSIKTINKKLRNNYPSQLRNRVNYQPMYGLNYIDNKLYQLNTNISWCDYLLNFKDTNDDNEIACYMYAYTKYIENFCYNFIFEYYDLRGRENGILKKYNTNSNKRVVLDKPQYVF